MGTDPDRGERREHDDHGVDPDVVEVFSMSGDDGVRVSGLSSEQVADVLRADGNDVWLHGADETDRPLDTAGLTEREAVIVRLIAAGRSNADIAQSEFLSINTVKSHIRTAYRRMGVETRSQAVLWAVQHGLAAPEHIEEGPPTDQRS